MAVRFTEPGWYPSTSATPSSTRPSTVRTAGSVATPSMVPAGGTIDIDKMIRDQVAAQLAKVAPVEVTNPLPSTPEQVKSWIFEHYGYMAAYINDPTIGKILMEAARKGITNQNELFGMLSGTRWWQTTSANARQYDFLKATDPATLDQQAQALSAQIRNRAATLGINLGGDLSGFTHQAMRMGWQTEQIDDYLLQRVEGVQSFTSGQLGAYASQVKQLAGQYLIPVSDATAASYARRIASGEATLEGIATSYAHSAKARFDWMADQMDAYGTTPLDYFQPMRERLASLLELTPDEIDPMDPQWLSLMEVVDSKSGKRRGATDTEVVDAAKRDPRWFGTHNAQNLYANLSIGLAQQLGAI